MVKRIKCTPASFTLEQAQEASRTYAEKTNRLETIEAKMTDEVNQVKTRYTNEITQIKEQLELGKDFLEQYANEQRTSWGDKKSCELVHCKLAFRDNPPRVAKQKQFTWDAVLELMKKHKKFQQFIRVKEEINKEAILSLNALDKKDSSLLKKLNNECFLFIEQQPESFFVTPKKEALLN